MSDNEQREDIETVRRSDWKDRFDGSRVRHTAGAKDEKFIRGYEYQPPDMEHSEPYKIWDERGPKYDNPEKALKAAPKFQQRQERLYERDDLPMVKKASIADVLIDGIDKLKDPAKRAAAMTLAKQLAGRSAELRNQQARGNVMVKDQQQQQRVKDVDLER